MARAFRTLALLAAVALAAGCTVHDTPAPSLTGPSELALSLAVAATPDTIAQDGSAQALVVVIARDAAGRAVAGLPIRFDVEKDGKIQDYGVLSAKTVTTAGDGRASVLYTAPAPPLDSPQPQTFPTTVSVLATPIGSNYASVVPRAVEIRLVPAGPVPPSDTVTASFLYAPTAPGVGVSIAFNATGSKSPVGVAAYAWDFGDGTIGNGVVVQHTYGTAGTYAVRLTITDTKGQTAWTTQYVSVAAPKASFMWSPATPTIVLPATEVTVTFDAGLSWVDPPATIVSYAWEFGDGGVGTGLTARHNFSAALTTTFPVTLRVTDSNGVTSTITKSVTVTVR
jgi:PKD repeat protein